MLGARSGGVKPRPRLGRHRIQLHNPALAARTAHEESDRGDPRAAGLRNFPDAINCHASDCENRRGSRSHHAGEAVKAEQLMIFVLGRARPHSSGDQVIDAGHVRLDGKRVEKPSEDVHIGSVIALPLHDRVRVLRVRALPDRRGSASEARACYEELGVDEARTRS